MALFKSRSKPALDPAPPGEGEGPSLDREELVVARRPFGRLADQYRRLRNAIQALNPDGAARSVLLTSAVRGEGKTVATVNLGLAMAELPRLRVLLIDAHVRDPKLEQLLGLPRRMGFTDVIAGRLPLDEAIRRTPLPNLDVVGPGTPPEHPGAALQVERARQILHSLKRRYDYVLIDSPSATEVADPSLMGTVADGIVLVVRVGSTPRHLVEETYNMLEGLGGNVLGTLAVGVEEVEEDAG